MVSSPSLVAPILAHTFAAGAGPVARITSSRVMTILTGRPDFWDSFTASGSR